MLFFINSNKTQIGDKCNRMNNINTIQESNSDLENIFGMIKLAYPQLQECDLKAIYR